VLRSEEKLIEENIELEQFRMKKSKLEQKELKNQKAKKRYSTHDSLLDVLLMLIR